MDYYHDVWVGYLTGVVIQRCLELSILRCPGCKDKLKLPILHQHQQHSLLEKLKVYFNEVRGCLLPTIDQLYDIAKNKLPHSNDETKDNEIYTNNARFFLQTATPETLYFGRYLCDQNDYIINELLTQKPSKRKHQAPEQHNSKRKKTKSVPEEDDLEKLLRTFR